LSSLSEVDSSNEAEFLADLVSISSTFYSKLLCTQITKALKFSLVQDLFVLLVSACVKAARKHVGEIDPRILDLTSNAKPRGTIKKTAFTV